MAMQVDCRFNVREISPFPTTALSTVNFQKLEPGILSYLDTVQVRNRHSAGQTGES